MSVLILVLLGVAVPIILWRVYRKAMQRRKDDQQGFTDPEQLSELLDDWNRKHRPDLWARGGGLAEP
jgi:hypothetical protein